MTDALYLTDVRLSYPHFDKPNAPRGFPNARLTYNCVLIVDPGPQWEKFAAAVKACAKEKWPEVWEQALERIQGDRRTRGFGNGKEKVNRKTMEVDPAYTDKYFIEPKSEERPALYNSDGSRIDSKNLAEYNDMCKQLYGGCYVNAVIQPWAQDNENGIGLRVELIGIQFLRDGERFGRTPVNADEMFKPTAEHESVDSTEGFF